MKLNVKQEKFLNEVPHQPGVYRFFSIVDELLYVGKAINLHKRVKSYFQKTMNQSPRISLMVSHIDYLEFTITENEISALILENNLIKSLKPKYNIIFRDDKSYPLIRLTRHNYPKIDIYRGKTRKDGYFSGPYPNAFIVKKSIDTIQRLFKIRTCSDSFFANRTRPCMLYQIKRCSAPCVKLVTDNEYNLQVKECMNFLEGRYFEIINDLTQNMHIAAQNMEFEVAASIRDKISIVKQISGSQIISNYNKPVSADIILFEIKGKTLFIYLIILRNGMYVGDNNFVLNKDEEDNEIFEVFLENYYIENRNTKQIYTQMPISSEFSHFFYAAFKIKIANTINPQVKSLYEMARVNLNKIIDNHYKTNNLLEGAIELGILFKQDKIGRIECIDISHNHGDSGLASLVVYENGIIDHSKYKKYNVPSEIKGNDLLAIRHVLGRRLANKDLALPDVILIDGGPTQFNTVKNIVDEFGLYDKIRVAAIFKGEKRNPELDRVMLDSGVVLAYAEAKSLFKLLQGLRDEAHRFAITGHRKKQVAKMKFSKLEEIPNIGAQKRRALISYFGSVRDIANASINDLQKVNGIGSAIAKQIYLYFH